MVHIRNLQEFFDYVMEKRNISPADCLLKLMGETGGDFFKFCMQVIDMTKVLKEKSQVHVSLMVSSAMSTRIMV